MLEKKGFVHLTRSKKTARNNIRKIKMDQKKLFFGFEVCAPWPEELPQGRVLEKENRHMTFAFLGQTDYPRLMDKLPSLPYPPFKVGLSGQFDQCL